MLVITGEGLKTLDAVRGTFETHEIDAVASSRLREHGRAGGASASA